MTHGEAGWMAYLTERDRQHLDVSGLGKSQPFGFGTRPALVLVDVYYAAVGLERMELLDAVRTWPLSCGLDGWRAIDRMVPLVAAARAGDIPVVYIKRMSVIRNSWGSRDKRNRHAHLPSEARAKAYEIVEEVAPRDGDVVIEKAAPSAFQGTTLSFYLNAAGIDTLIVCGETTSGCVRATVVDGATLRYRMGVVGECCFDRTEASHQINLFDMHQKYADIVSVEEAAEYFRSVDGQDRGRAQRSLQTGRKRA